MGKRARKTRWRALDIADEHSDSEESNTNSSAVSSRNSHSYSSGYYSKYPYSSQSTPARRRYNQYDGSAKSTRSSSTTSENKITFNEDEYTRITTPRQDVLFKKGYLNKPKNYQTQTSTGNSTISTGNSTENGTPDHQSTDLDYESQFMFPNGFVDQNGIYYVNSYEPYPLMLFNPPTYFQEFSSIKSKRMSTGSLSESMSPNNEETTSQDLSPSGGDASNSVSDYSGGHPVYNMVFPGYYVNGACTPTDLANGHHLPQEPVKKLKKRRERKSSKNIQEDSSEYTDDNYSCDENHESIPCHRTDPITDLPASEHPAEPASRLDAPSSSPLQAEQDCSQNEAEISNPKEELKTVCKNSNPSDNTLANGCADAKTESNDDKPELDQAQPSTDCQKASILKPDAEEFVPRCYVNLGPPPHFKMLPPNFMPIPLVPISDFGGQSFAPHPAFIPPGIPINFIPHHPGQKMFPPAPGFANFAPPMIHEAKIEEIADKNEESISDEKEKQNITTPSHTPIVEDSKTVAHSKIIDIATVVSKLEAVKQKEKESDVSKEENSLTVVNETKPFIGSPRFKRPVLKRNYYNKYRSSPVRSGEASPQIQNGGNSPQLQESLYRLKNSSSDNGSLTQKRNNGETLNYKNLPICNIEIPQQLQNGDPDSLKYKHLHVHYVKVQNGQYDPSNHRNSPVRNGEAAQIVNGHVTEKPTASDVNHSNKAPSTHSLVLAKVDGSKQVRNSPERPTKNWKPNGYQNGYQSHRQNTYHSCRPTNNQHNFTKQVGNGFEKPHFNGDVNPPLGKYYSATLKKAQIISPTPSTPPSKHINTEKSVKAGENVTDESPKSELVKSNSNQWISVSSRKKKKNKNMEEVDFDVEQDMLSESAQSDNISSDFEIYDVSQLVDVVPTLKVEHSTEQEKNIEDILTVIAQNEPSEVLANGLQTQTDIKILEVSDIEKDIIVKIEEEKDTALEKTPKEILTLNLQTEEEKNGIIIADECKPKIKDDEKEDTYKPKKKSKKGTQKPLTKKVIITDIDLSMTVDEVKTPVKKMVTKVEEVKSQPQVPAIIVPEENIIAKVTAPEVSSEPTEKKSKKKKKNKTPKIVPNASLSGSNGTLNTSDDSYELFTENGVLNETLEITNDDISLELEKLIQKGMYSSLQEKIKSLNVEPEADGFFKNFQPVPSSGKDKTTANGFMKTPDFNKIFQSTRQLVKPNMVSLEKDNSDNKVAVDDIHNKDNKTSCSAVDAADSSSGHFLENAKAQVQEIQEATTEVTIEPKAPAKESEDQEDNKKLYPITQAVKEWMSKTREATPEVEILKSPSTIQREFGDNGIPEDDLNDPLDSDEDEVILFSTDDTINQEQPDLLEYWEDDVVSPEGRSKGCEKADNDISYRSKVCSGGKSCAKCQNDSVKEGEEEIEVYESKYGQNDAFLKLQTELKEKQASLPQSLPHRTVCCSLQ